MQELGGKIEKEDIDILSTKQMQAIIFDLTNNLGIKNTAKSIEILDNLLYNKEPHQRIIINLYNHFKKLYIIKLFENENSRLDINQVLNLKPNQLFLVPKYKKQCMRFSENELENILMELVDLDYKSKSGLIDIDIGLRTILCKNS